jgi:hypothetical protein
VGRGTRPRGSEKRKGKSRPWGGRKDWAELREVRERINPFSFLFSHLFSNHLKEFKNHFEIKETSLNKT